MDVQQVAPVASFQFYYETFVFVKWKGDVVTPARSYFMSAILTIHILRQIINQIHFTIV